MSFSGFRLSGFETPGDRDRDGRMIHEERRVSTRTKLTAGTLACSACDAPVHPGPRLLRPSDPLRCPFCDHHGHVRDFLSLEPPTRPARVIVRIVLPPG